MFWWKQKQSRKKNQICLKCSENEANHPKIIEDYIILIKSTTYNKPECFFSNFLIKTNLNLTEK